MSSTTRCGISTSQLWAASVTAVNETLVNYGTVPLDRDVDGYLSRWETNEPVVVFASSHVFEANYNIQSSHT
ncbi:hypothetical protein SARC_07909 [Sphaeroforma arctica JP610]|uniref:Uncharacterized protein n=1 Tax=Sphaeroforma arctica JP610 TaxID=667725 RepID=A0A0L0FUT7_9EUKA|nr:hypothetical protein SARC_07909 [Sphaeroforma arctica JP610]KNC79698.1 hypothetical protein SARC_07909 [Sphaeroforma arctica JP610]|eukprot:XP_014153600.1 hypothetical protein SARC_07909 [Sphaeroforma arctica JP610]